MLFSQEMTRIKRNPEYHEGTEKPRYFLELDFSQVVREGVKAALPVYWHPNPSPHPMLKEFYWTEVGGVRLEKGNLAALEKAIPEAIMGIVDFNTIPYYYLCLPSKERFPVYLSEGKLRLRLKPEPMFVADDIGQLRQKFTDYLLKLNKISAREEIEVELLLWKDLRVCLTAFAFCSDNFWFPIFRYPSPKGITLVYDIIGKPSRFLSPEEVFDLRQELGLSLVSSRILRSPAELKMVEMREDIWQKIKEKMSPADCVLCYYVDGTKMVLPVYQVRKDFLTMENGKRAKVVFEADVEDLLRRFSVELSYNQKGVNVSSLTAERIKGR